MDIQSVRNAFDRFGDVWNFDDFWTRANTFDACINCFTAAAAQFPGDPNIPPMRAVLDQLITANITYYGQNNMGKYQADHFGWWGLASLNAYKLLAKTNDPRATNYLEISNDAWHQMVKRGWDIKSDAQPVPGGCFNSAILTEQLTKTTTANLVLLVLSMRLMQVVGSADPHYSRYVSVAYSQYVWFRTWFSNTYDGFNYLRQALNVVSAMSFIQERPFAAPDYESVEHPTSQKLCVWTADQGTLLASLLALLEIESDLAAWGANQNPKIQLPSTFKSEITGWFNLVAIAVRSMLFFTGAFDADSVLREAPFKALMSESFGHVKDYLGGRGVLLRYLGGMKGQLTQMPFKASVSATATKALATCGTDYQFAANWTNDSPRWAASGVFVQHWGGGTWGMKWPYDSSVTDPVILGVLQGQGLDVLGAAIAFM
jgi:hypothetical protein